MNPIWKVLKKVLDGRLVNLQCHDCLYGFLANRGCGTTILKTNLAQQLAFLEQEQMFGGFIYLKKAFNAMHREICVEILQNHGMGEKAMWLITTFRKEAVLVYLAGGSYR